MKEKTERELLKVLKGIQKLLEKLDRHFKTQESNRAVDLLIKKKEPLKKKDSVFDKLFKKKEEIK